MKLLFKSILIGLVITGCSSSPDNPKTFGKNLNGEMISPNREFILKTISHSVDFEQNGNKWWYANFQIIDTNGNVKFKDTEDYATWFKLEAKWNSSNEITIQSSDVGNTIIKYVNGQWVKVRSKN